MNPSRSFVLQRYSYKRHWTGGPLARCNRDIPNEAWGVRVQEFSFAWAMLVASMDTPSIPALRARRRRRTLSKVCVQAYILPVYTREFN